ncbi:hypothetical protein HRbin36_02323 [bacterium HR36]|nr:hypothetical protein HRbin36_02323 [bacterium HR36]
MQHQWRGLRAEIQGELRAARKEQLERLMERQQSLMRLADRITDLALGDPEPQVRQLALQTLALLQPDLTKTKVLAAWKTLLQDSDRRSALVAARACRIWFETSISDLTNPRLETVQSLQAGRKMASDLAVMSHIITLALNHPEVAVRAEILATLDEVLSVLVQRLNGLQSQLGLPEYRPLAVAMAADLLKVTQQLSRSLRDCLGLPHSSVRQPACRLLESLANLVQVWREEALQPEGGKFAEQLQSQLAFNIPDLLTVALSDPNREVRLQALLAVESIEPLSSRTWPALLEALHDPYPPARWAAARSLETGRSTGLSESERAAIVRVLARRLMEENEVGVRLRLAHTLQTWRTDLLSARQEIAAALANAASDWPGVKRGPFAPAHRQARRQVRDQDVLLALLEAVRESVQHQRLASREPLPEEWLPGLVASLDAEKPAVRLETCRILAIYGPQAFAARPALMRLLQDTDLQVRGAAAAALLRITPAPQ